MLGGLFIFHHTDEVYVLTLLHMIDYNYNKYHSSCVLSTFHGGVEQSAFWRDGLNRSRRGVAMLEEDCQSMKDSYSNDGNYDC